MNQTDLLRCIAEAAYNIGFGAKKHFATYDITDKVPAVIGFASTAIGIYSLFVDALAKNWVSATFITLGILGLSIAFYDHKKEHYAEAGAKLTEIFSRLKRLYFEAKSAVDADLPRLQSELEALEKEAAAYGISDQILFSGWFAHYKFFWEQQIEWVDEQKHFRFWRDKIPLSLIVSVVLLIAAVIASIINS